jgi:hypothetical protein
MFVYVNVLFVLCLYACLNVISSFADEKFSSTLSIFAWILQVKAKKAKSILIQKKKKAL